MATKNLAPLFLLAAAFAAVSLSGCGRASAAAPASAVTATQATAQPRAVLITANDTMRFNTTEIYAKPGEALAVTLTNEGTIPKVAMGHNWVLLTPDTDLISFAQNGASAAATNYIPEAFKANVLAATNLLGPKESQTVIFTAPKKSGRYPYICAFPGHMQVGMKGELVVE